MRFDDIIAPVPADRFLADHYGRAPLHIPASGADKAKPLDWSGFSALLAILPHWTEHNLRLILNSRAIEPHFYSDEIVTPDGTRLRASPERVEIFLAMGASLVANGIQDIAPAVRDYGEVLGDQFAGQVGVNAYCSFGGIQAFASHYDPSEIFVLHCEGEKDWRIYANREPAPIDVPDANAQARIEARKGPVLMELRMKPGDILYIPRGFYHDATASSGASLHLTFAVNPLYGRILFRLLEEEAMRDPDFRAWLPDARDGRHLAQRLAELAPKVEALMRAPALEQAVALKQAKLRRSRHSFALPERPSLDWYAATGRPAEIVVAADGWRIRASGLDQPLGLAHEAARWLLTRPAFSVQELIAAFRHVSPDALQALVRTLDRHAIIQRCAAPSA